MTTKSQVEELNQLLSKMPQRTLVEAMIKYAEPNNYFARHFIALARIHEDDSRVRILQSVMTTIECVFGNDSLPGSLSWDERCKFTYIQDLIDTLCQAELFDEAIQSAEHCFEHVPDLAGVHWPDDFLEQCFDPIVRTWILALHGARVSAISIAHQVAYLETSDGYGAFYNLQGKFAKELGEEVLIEMALLRKSR